jgi:hypothetical protein
MRSVSDIISEAGGPNAVADEVTKARAKPFSADGVRKWHQNGIPDRYWGILAELCNATPDELFAANEALRSPTTVAAE